MSTTAPEAGRHTEAALRRYLDEAAAAEVMGLKPRTLQEWRRKGVGPAFVKLSQKCLRYDLRVIEAFMAERTRTSTSDNGGVK